MPVPQLLMLYNARFHARTIRDHVEHLRTHGHVWWGRFYNGPKRFTTDEARARWAHVAKLADERSASGEPSLVFASNHQALHVFKVTRILFGDDPGENARAESLAYYADKSVPIWFKIEDARALSHEHATTNDWLSNQFGPIVGGSAGSAGREFTQAYDPTAAVLHQYPIVLEAPSWDELFHRRTLTAGLKRWADARDAISSRPVQTALDYLDTFMDARAWKRASSEAKEQMAGAWVTRGMLERDFDINPANGFNDVARAVEIELRDELIEALTLVVARHKLGKLAEGIATARGSDRRGELRPWTLGTVMILVKSLAASHRRELAPLGLQPLIDLSLDTKWLTELQDLRNVTTHWKGREGMDPKLEAKKALYAFFDRRGKDLMPILDARDAVRRAAQT
jgi:hypothetical protein